MNNTLRIGLVAAALLITAVITACQAPASGGAATSSPSAAASSTTEATPAATPSAYVMSLPDQSGHATLILPAGWYRDVWNVQKGQDLFLSVWPAPIANVYGDPCHWEGSLPDPAVGPTVGDLVTALANQPTRNATVEDASLGGYNGSVVHMSVPTDIDLADCDLGLFGIWTEAGSDSPARYDVGPGELDDIYVLDVEGLRTTIDAAWFPSSAAADVAELEEMLATITIQP